VSHHRHHWSRDKRPSIEREWEAWAIKASMARPALPDVPRPVPMTINQIIAQACAQDAAYAAARAAWEATWVDGMPEHLKAYREAVNREWAARKEKEATEPRPPRATPSRPKRSARQSCGRKLRDPNVTAKNGRPSIAHLTPAERRVRKIEQTKASNLRRKQERKELSQCPPDANPST
jgi:hypothetical protein